MLPMDPWLSANAIRATSCPADENYGCSIHIFCALPNSHKLLLTYNYTDLLVIYFARH